NFSCHRFQVADGLIRCDAGMLRLSGLAPLPVTFDLSSRHKTLDLQIGTASGAGAGGWRLSARWEGAEWEGILTVANGQAAQIAQLLPESEGQILPGSVKGNVNGTIKAHGNASGRVGIEADLAVDGVAFSDAAGQHAGEDISVAVNANASRSGGGGEDGLWEWRADVNWPKGGIFWQPLYFAGQDHRFSASGDLDKNALRLREGKLVLSGIGEMELSGVADPKAKTLRDFDVVAANLGLAGLFNQAVKPFLTNSPFAELETAGNVGIQWRYRDGANEFFDLDLRDISLEDGHGRFALRGVNARIPWKARELTKADIRIQSSQLGKVPIGELRIPLEIEGEGSNSRIPGFRIPHMRVPILDGEFTLENFSASPQAQGSSGWQWQFSGGLSPISMQKLTEALDVHPMQGTLSGQIPRVGYNGSSVDMDGALIFKVFDGTVELKHLKLLDPMGRAATLMADVDMRNLDLNLLTGTFSFGSMQGRIDAAVHGLELFNWKPVKFDASLRSSPGDYPRRISQAAVQNISSLGGAGAAAAIQRSVLHFFEQFGYSEIGWSCSLRNGICRMGGIESEPLPYGYLIVKGGGIPAITVLGYNRNVDWWELVRRLERITQANVKPVIQH
ncbi:MAG: hypothetical protein KGM95_04515, partial [Betaproteobacteria bacterium]|nr:hypothetical protein [Betaproteobacteria bacterium]